MNIPELCALTALQQHALIASREISCAELLTTHLQWIEAINPDVNAICTLDAEAALTQAQAADARLTEGAPARPLEGLPAVIKDLVNAAGLLTTYGSPLFRDNVAEQDALHVARIRAAGGIIIGKSNTPEWGAGSQSFNTLFGTTATPWDLSRTAGGSSGGAAAALAARMVPIADGSDLGGSLRNPAAFCNVVGLRPTPGRVPAYPSRDTLWNPLAVLGPMGRTVADAARLMSVMAGPDLRAPLSLESDPSVFAESLESATAGLKLAWSPDLGFLPVQQPVRDVAAAAMTHFEALDCRVEAAAPKLDDAAPVFQTLRAHQFALNFGRRIESDPDAFKDTIHWNTRQGLSLNAEDVGRAAKAHGDIYLRTLEFFDEFDFLLVPSTQVLPFNKELDWVREIEGVQFENYLQWMEICCVISVTGCPSVSVPCGFTAEGLPVGLQIVGPPRSDLNVLRLAHMFEQATGYTEKTPELPG